jgi:hypothetical protein
MRTPLLIVPGAVAALITLGAASSPRITGVAVTPPGQSSSPQVLAVSGENFMARLSLVVTTPGGEARSFKDADIQSQTETSFKISMALATAGTYSLVVTNPDGGASGAFALKVAATPPATPEPPIIDAVRPSPATARPDAQPLRVDGKRFVAGLTVYVTDPTGEVANVTDVGDLTSTGFRVSAVLAMEGQYTLNIKNPDGGISNAFTLTVTKAR